jgi:hypothetical protein
MAEHQMGELTHDHKFKEMTLAYYTYLVTVA